MSSWGRSNGRRFAYKSDQPSQQDQLSSIEKSCLNNHSGLRQGIVDSLDLLTSPSRGVDAVVTESMIGIQTGASEKSVKYVFKCLTRSLSQLPVQDKFRIHVSTKVSLLGTKNSWKRTARSIHHVLAYSLRHLLNYCMEHQNLSKY